MYITHGPDCHLGRSLLGSSARRAGPRERRASEACRRQGHEDIKSGQHSQRDWGYVRSKCTWLQVPYFCRSQSPGSVRQQGLFCSH